MYNIVDYIWLEKVSIVLFARMVILFKAWQVELLVPQLHLT